MKQQPTDWSSPAGWDDYYSALTTDGDFLACVRNTGSISVDRVPQLIQELKEASVVNIWIPGCGISLLPKLLSTGGLNVRATDSSRRAVEFQMAASPELDVAIAKSGVAESAGGKLTCEVHDFRTPYLSEAFDLIINVKAFQTFPEEEMRSIASVHFDALKPASRAIFDTLNVQGERRDLMERVLVDAGFYLPFYAANVEYRRQLTATGIPYVFVLGRPVIPRRGEYVSDGEKRERDMALLREISSRHGERLQSESKSVAEHYKNNPKTKTVSMIYSTG